MRLLIILCAILSTNLFARTIKLADVSNDYDREIGDISLILDESSDIVNFVQTGYLNGRQIYKYTHVVEDLYKRTSIYQRKGRNIVDLVSSNLTSHQGGIFDVSYLYNGLTGSRMNFEMDLVRDGDEWNIAIDGKKIQKIKFIINKKPIVGAIGVKAVRFN